MAEFMSRAVVVALLGLGLFTATPRVTTDDAALAATTQTAPSDKLAKVEAKVDNDYQNVKQMSAAELEKLRNSSKDLVIFDVREKSEFDVSHIEGAQQLDPGTWGWTFMRKYGERLKGKTIVFYCSVGVRSSKMAQRVQKELAAKGAKGIFNLRGGIFRWHNDKRPLMSVKGKTPYVHPYDKYWGKLVNRQSYISYKPTK